MTKFILISVFVAGAILLISCGRSTKVGDVTLNLSGESKIESPSEEVIAESIYSLVDDMDHFLILESSNMTYLQCIGDAQKGYIVEYQEGSTDRHYSSGRNRLDADHTVRIFLNYAKGSDDWKNGISWEKISL